ncbi:flagellar filament capping protein FliD [Tepidimonas taiwanensis]|uniref:flagellar filament capping protein FliD n=1 Tax=Tepidimonas taiwanensis TaxID=307486 RepID=UPI0007348938|nr:flagellar filament capping protein FliD [Tepidimonas taiwanensis]
MAISSPGVGSGLDVNNIISQLVALERKPIQQLQSQKTIAQTRLSQWGQIKSALSTLQDAANALRSPSLWNSRTASVSGAGVTATASAGTTAGSFTVSVTQLASEQKLSTNATYGTGALGWSGKLSITKGEWSGGSFTPGSAPTVDVTIAAGDKLSDIASKINAAGAGVTATVVNTGSGLRLAIRSNTTGEANGFSIRAYDSSNNEITNGTGLGGLTYATGITNGMNGSLATDAQLSIDGVAVSSASNTVNAVPGITLTLTGTNTTPAVVTVDNDTKAIRGAIETFQKAYNDLNTLLRNATRADTTGKGDNGPLVGDQTAQTIQRALRNVVGATGPGGLAFSRLSDIGLQVARDGSLTLNATKLDAALSNLSDLRTFFDDTSAGIATQVRDITSRLTAFDGAVETRRNGLQKTLARQDESIARLENRVARTEAMLRAQYTRLDSTLAGLNGLSTYVSQQLAQWNKQG